jgi:hypothetical protein
MVMKRQVVREEQPAPVCEHGIQLARLDVWLAAIDGVARSMYCADCRRDEHDEIDAELGQFLTEPGGPFSVEQIERSSSRP